MQSRRAGSSIASVVLLFGFGAGLAACGSGSNAGSSSSQASKLLATAFKNAIAAQWVHEVIGASQPGHSFSEVNDIGTTAGRELIVSDGARSTTLLVDHTVYLRGDAKAVVSYYHLPKHPRSYAGKWISISSKNRAYVSTSTGVTLASDFSHIKLLGPFSEGSVVTIDGVRAVPINAHVTPTANSSATAVVTLYVTASGLTLPVEFHAVSGKIIETITWSGWGHKVTIVAPRTSIPLAKVLHG
jgi:hypothetical protein